MTKPLSKKLTLTIEIEPGSSFQEEVFTGILETFGQAAVLQAEQSHKGNKAIWRLFKDK